MWTYWKGEFKLIHNFTRRSISRDQTELFELKARYCIWIVKNHSVYDSNRCTAFTEYIDWKAKQDDDTPETPDDFLVKFNELYKSTGQFRNSVVVGLAKAIVARHTGHLNAPAPHKVIAFLNIL